MAGTNIVEIDFSKSCPTVNTTYAGEIAEVNGVTLKVTPETVMTENTSITSYHLEFAIPTGIVSSRAYTTTEDITCDLWGQLTQQEVLELQLVATNTDGSIQMKTPIVRLYLEESITGTIVGIDDSHDSIIAQLGGFNTRLTAVEPICINSGNGGTTPAYTKAQLLTYINAGRSIGYRNNKGGVVPLHFNWTNDTLNALEFVRFSGEIDDDVTSTTSPVEDTFGAYYYLVTDTAITLATGTPAVRTSRKINNKALSSDITLGITDIPNLRSELDDKGNAPLIVTGTQGAEITTEYDNLVAYAMTFDKTSSQIDTAISEGRDIWLKVNNTIVLIDFLPSFKEWHGTFLTENDDDVPEWMNVSVVFGNSGGVMFTSWLTLDEMKQITTNKTNITSLQSTVSQHSADIVDLQGMISIGTDTPSTDAKLWVDTDDGELPPDYATTSYVNNHHDSTKANASDLTSHTGDSTIHISSSDRTNWNAKADAEDIPTKTSDLTNDSGFITEHQSLSAYRTSSAQDVIDNNKVDKVSGKGLSTEDFTSAFKTKLENVESGAEVNDIDTIKVNGTEQTITDKTVDITVPTDAEDIYFEPIEGKVQAVDVQSAIGEIANDVYAQYELIEEITLTEDTSSIVRTQTPSTYSGGVKDYDFKHLYVEIDLSAVSTTPSSHYLIISLNNDSVSEYNNILKTTGSKVSLTAINVGGKTYTESRMRVTNTWSGVATYGNYARTLYDISTIIKLSVAMHSQSLPSGSVIKIYGIWA